MSEHGAVDGQRLDAGVDGLRVDVRKRLGSMELRMSFTADAGILVLFGPSGAGKTATLDMVAGLLDPDEGEVVLDGETFFRRGRGAAVRVPARRRRIGYVFQQYALFPHMTALENVMYPLRGPQKERRARALLERVRLDGAATHYPLELSGGQQQRVAIARAIATEPRLLLLDEPFSALDAAVREHLQHDVADLQAELGLVVLYVTHRLEDAFAVGHRIAVVHDGTIEQLGPIEEVFRHPANARVAGTMGIRNLLTVRVVESTPEALLLDWDGVPLTAPARAARPGDAVLAYIPPEEVKLLYPDRPLSRSVAGNHFAGHVRRIGRGASYRELSVVLPNGREVELRFPLLSYAGLDLAPGAPVQVALRREALVLLPAS